MVRNVVFFPFALPQMRAKANRWLRLACHIISILLITILVIWQKGKACQGWMLAKSTSFAV
jgi:hypothetical protein